MPYRICKSFEIEKARGRSAFQTSRQVPLSSTAAPGRYEFVLEADALDGNDMVCDFKVVKEIVSDFLEGYDHALCMNTADPEFARMNTAAYGDRVIAFTDVDPTTEVMAETIFRFFTAQLAEYAENSTRKYPVRSQVRLISVRLWETSSSWAEFTL